MSDEQKTLGQRLAYAIEQSGRTQKWILDQTKVEGHRQGVHRTMLNKILRDTTKPGMEIIQLLCNALDLCSDWLLFGIGNMYRHELRKLDFFERWVIDSIQEMSPSDSWRFQCQFLFFSADNQMRNHLEITVRRVFAEWDSDTIEALLRELMGELSQLFEDRYDMTGRYLTDFEKSGNPIDQVRYYNRERTGYVERDGIHVQHPELKKMEQKIHLFTRLETDKAKEIIERFKRRKSKTLK